MLFYTKERKKVFFRKRIKIPFCKSIKTRTTWNHPRAITTKPYVLSKLHLKFYIHVLITSGRRFLKGGGSNPLRYKKNIIDYVPALLNVCSVYLYKFLHNALRTRFLNSYFLNVRTKVDPIYRLS